MRRPGGDVACQPELQRPASGGCGAAVDPSDWRTGPGSRNGQRRRAGMPDAGAAGPPRAGNAVTQWPRRQRRWHSGCPVRGPAQASEARGAAPARLQPRRRGRPAGGPETSPCRRHPGHDHPASHDNLNLAQ